MSVEKVFPPFWRRLAAIAYESLPVLAIIIGVGFLFIGLAELVFGNAGRLPKAHRVALFICWYAAIGAYFIFCWRRGQTLPMRAWRLRLATPSGAPVPVRNVLARFAMGSAAWCTAIFALMWIREHTDSFIGWACLAPVVIACGWALFDRNHQTLYDKLAGTELILEAPARRAGR